MFHSSTPGNKCSPPLVCVGTSQYRDTVCSDSVLIWGCSVRVNKWHLRDLNAVLNHPVFDPWQPVPYCADFFSPDSGHINQKNSGTGGRV